MMAHSFVKWLDARTGLLTTLNQKKAQAVPAHMSFFYCFGGISLLIILMQLVTGIYMTFYYAPHPHEALRSIEAMSNGSVTGAMMRNMHRWGSTLLLATLFSHMITVVLHKAYRNPRELNWLSGVFQFILVVLLLATGLILPWDWRAYWSFAIWADYLESWPLVGSWLKNALLDHFTINRGFVLHVLILPALLGILLNFHFRMVRRHGIAGPL
ncbi:MAG: cytochrome b N-terminal domain-containing protein [Magnetococcus sp. YQC-5]